ncbi:porin, partial [Salmonella enterica subsp. enterica serovar Cerro]|nr:porin [Salmonella enterica subsp. enterica serovar Cerro]
VGVKYDAYNVYLAAMYSETRNMTSYGDSDYHSADGKLGGGGMESLPPAKFVQDRSGSHGMTLNSLVSGGCIISGSVVVQSVLF